MTEIGKLAVARCIKSVIFFMCLLVAPGVFGAEPGPGEPELVVAVPPVYPEQARASQIEGWVRLEFTVNEKGRVVDAVVLESTHEMFEKPALEAIEQCFYRPAAKEGRTVATPGVRIKMRFEPPETDQP